MGRQERQTGEGDKLEKVLKRLDRIEGILESLQLPKAEKYFYSTGEVAKRLGLSKWYVRRLCALGEIEAERHPENGRHLICAEELERIESRRDVLQADEKKKKEKGK